MADGLSFSMGGQISMGDKAPSASNELIKDTNTANFMADVIETSRTVPVIVDFWAPWCGPCKQLTPALEKCVTRAAGKVRLVKINVDENQQLAGQMRVQSIPAVFGFVDGQPVDGFMGALPEGQIDEFIKRLAGKAGPGEELAGLLEGGKAALEDEDAQAAMQAFAKALQLDRENLAAIAGLARAQILAGDIAGAEATLEMTPPDKATDPEITGARAALELAANPADSAEISRLSAAIEAEPGDHASRFDLAVALNADGRREEAADHLLAIIAKDRAWNDEAARNQLLQFFEAWGATDPLTVASRRKLSSILFA